MHILCVWFKQVQNKQITLSGNVFAVLSQRGSTKSTLCLGVNFQTEIIELIKEVILDFCLHVVIIF